PQAPAELERIVNKALEKDRELRFQSAVELRSDLKRLKRNSLPDGSAISADGVTRLRVRLPRRRLALAMLGAAASRSATESSGLQAAHQRRRHEATGGYRRRSSVLERDHRHGSLDRRN